MPGILLLETIRAGDCGRPRRVVAQTRGRPRQVLLYIFINLRTAVYHSEPHDHCQLYYSLAVRALRRSVSRRERC